MKYGISDVQFLIFVEDEEEPRGFPDVQSAFGAASDLIADDKSFDVVSAYKHVMRPAMGIEGVFSPDVQMIEHEGERSGQEAIDHMEEAFDVRVSFHWDAKTLVAGPRQYHDKYAEFHANKSLGEVMMPPADLNGIALCLNHPKFPQPKPGPHFRVV